MRQLRDERGFALVMVMLLVAVLASLLAGYFLLTKIDLTTTRSSLDGTRGFYAAEAGLNLRAQLVRDEFVGFARPDGTSPESELPSVPCVDANLGAGDFRCVDYTIEDRTATTYVQEDAGNPSAMVIPRGELFQNLAAQEFGYVVYSQAKNPAEHLEAVVEMRFHSRLVPVFQFAAFYDKDLEILPKEASTLSGPVHTNGDLYLGGGNKLDLLAQVTAAGTMYRGRKDDDDCTSGDPRVMDPGVLKEIPTCPDDGTTPMSQADLDAWDGMIRTGLTAVTPPGAAMIERAAGAVFWDRADLRVVLNLNVVPAAIEVRNADGGVNGGLTATLDGCGVTDHTTTMWNFREGAWMSMLEVNLQGLFDCINGTALLGAGKELDDTTDGGLILYLGVDGPLSGVLNNYGVRIQNGAELTSTELGAPPIAGLTVVTDQAMYILGDYNSVLKKPAAVLGDTINVLSSAWLDANSDKAIALGLRNAANTTINAALLGGTDTTGGIEGAAGQGLGMYNGGLYHVIRLHEHWNGRTLTLRGSLVSLHAPLHVDGAWLPGAPQYTEPAYDLDYDADLDDTANLPPLTPRFVYLEQEMFVRQFDL